MREKSLLGVLNLAVRADQHLDEAQEHEVFNLTLFLQLVGAFLLFADFLLLSLNLAVNFSSLFGSNALFLVALLLALCRSQVVDGLFGASFGRGSLFCRRLRGTLAQFVSLVESFVSVVHVFLFLAFFSVLAFSLSVGFGLGVAGRLGFAPLALFD